ncbi:MAG TPA: GNAT family N-acetyltransferase [Candidatus Eisenbacteria bacterium]|nr:GNAT family N-acetyltransferase [Candidatus Eisenbacteria bacterium]
MRPKEVRTRLEPASLRREKEFLEAVRRSRELHRPWTSPPSTPARARRYLAPRKDGRSELHFILTPAGEIAGVVEMSEIVRGPFRSAYLGFYALEPHQGRGYMTAGLAAAVRRAFGALRLHRVEANIQPANGASKALVRRVGFRKEGYSPRYLKIGGRWRDHERWALTREDWGR